MTKYVDMPVCADRFGRFISPQSIKTGDRVSVKMTLHAQLSPDGKANVSYRLRFVKRVENPIKGKDV